MIQLLSERDVASILRHVRDAQSPFHADRVDRAAAALWMAKLVGSIPQPDSPVRTTMVQAIGVTGDTIIFRHVLHSRRGARGEDFFPRVEHSLVEGGEHDRRRLAQWLILSIGASTTYAISRDIHVAEIVD